MEYIVRAFLLSSAAFTLLYLGLNGVAAAIWRAIRARQNSSRLLYALLLGPLALSMLFVAVVFVPSFVRYEPKTAEETVGWPLLLLAAGGALLLAAGAARAAYAWATTSYAVRGWMKSARKLDEVNGIEIYASDDAPAVVMTGLLRSRLLVSTAAIEWLSESEMRLVIEHERHHATHRDNLRRLLLALRCVPADSDLHDAWKRACELNADRTAVRSREEGIELATALLKISRLSCGEMPLATNFGTNNAELLTARVRSLMQWSSEQPSAATQHYIYLFMMTLAAVLVSQYGAVLWSIHRVSEWLMR